MKECCEIRADVLPSPRRVLRIVLWINALMFVAELGAGLLANSTSLIADSVDMLGDALVYGFSLSVVGRGAAWQARAALMKGGIMAVFGLVVVVEAATKIIRGVVPEPDVMASIGLIALAANAAVLFLLWRHRRDDLNMRSVWLCSRNDVAANVGVVAAASGVVITGAAWPDVTVGLLIALLFLTSATTILREARRQLRPGEITSQAALHANRAVEAPSRFNCGAASEDLLPARPNISNTGPTTPPATIAPASHGGVVTALMGTIPTIDTPVPLAETLSMLAQHPISVLRSALEPRWPPRTG